MSRRKSSRSYGPGRAVATVAMAVVAVSLWWILAKRPSDSDGAASGILLTTAALPAPPAPPERADFAGAAACQSCHAEEFGAWRGSTHGNAGAMLTGSGAADDKERAHIIAPFDGTPIRFRDATVIPRQRQGVFSFLVQRPGERDTTLAVSGVIGGGHMQGGGTQGFLTQWSDGTLRFLPFDWSRQNRTWFCNTGTRAAKGWVPISASLRLADCGDWPPLRVLGDEPRFSNCQSCHGSQIELTFDSTARRWETRSNGLAINCESCHGPAARHVALMRDGGTPSADIGLVALATLDKEQSLNVCLSCHALKNRLAARWQPSLSTGVTHRSAPGASAATQLTEFYALRLAQLGDAPLTEDGRTRTFAYQEGHLASECYRNGGMTCTSCHDPHSQHYRTATGEPIPGRTDDRQCTSCHASKATNVSAHTNHRAASVGSRCVACHMPYEQQHELGQAIRYARADHSIAIPRPAVDSTLGITSACRRCHVGTSEAQHDARVTTWWGPLKSHESAVAGVLAARNRSDIDAATPLLLRPHSQNATAQVAGLAQWLERFAEPDLPVESARNRSVVPIVDSALRIMAMSPDVDVRALALATLHFARGNDPGTRRFLRTQIERFGRDDGAIRRRWMIVLGGLGDAARASGDAARAVTSYRKALEIAPGAAPLLLNLGLAYAAAGDLPSAVRSYQQSIDADGQQPVALVNLGIALEGGGNPSAATTAYRRAITVDPTFAPAYLNLAASQLRAGDAASSIPNFELALAREPGLALGHFQFALALLKVGDRSRAERAVRRSLALDSSNGEAIRLANALREARGR